MFRLYFGVPGCGKTTYACHSLLKEKKRLNRKNGYSHIYCNFAQKLCPEVSLSGLGNWTFPPYSYIVIDEASIDFNNRKFKSLPQETIKWFKLHRHYHCDVDFISQSWDDVDVTVRRLVDEVYYLKRLGPVTMIKRVYKKIEIDEQSHQIIDGYRFGKFFPFFLKKLLRISDYHFLWRPKYYKYFDSYEAPPLPVRYLDAESEYITLSTSGD